MDTRREWLAALVIGLAAALVVGWLPGAASPLPAAISEVEVANGRDLTFAVSWLTDGAATGEVHFGTNPLNLNLIAPDVRGVIFSGETHFVTVSGLAASTLCHFDVASGAETDDNGGAHDTVTIGPTLPLPPTFSNLRRTRASRGPPSWSPTPAASKWHQQSPDQEGCTRSTASSRGPTRRPLNRCLA